MPKNSVPNTEAAWHTVQEMSGKQPGLFEDAARNQNVRPIHYLGSKLRLLGPIRAAIAELLKPGDAVLDLFSGSGSVSYSLSQNFSVAAVDIQEFSRVLASALLSDRGRRRESAVALMSRVESSPIREGLRCALSGLLDHEQRVKSEAARGYAEPLCALVDQGSLVLLSDAPNAQSSEDVNARSPQVARLLKTAMEELGRRGLATGSSTVVTRHFGGVYFSWEQAMELDVFLDAAHCLPQSLRDCAVAAVLSAASDAVNTVGKHFAQPIRLRDSHGRPKPHLVRQTLRDRSVGIGASVSTWLERLIALQPPRFAHTALRLDFRDALADPGVRFDAVYADPPYTRDHYSRFYHVLETMALHDEPELSRSMIRSGGHPRISRGVYRTDRHQSPFSIKSQAPRAFESLFCQVRDRGVPLVLSYSPYSAANGNRPRLMTVTDLSALAGQHFNHVEIRALAGTSHSKLNTTDRNAHVDYDAEVLLVCRP